MSYYTFLNGNCPDYSCKENLAGLPCGDPSNFNDRFLPAVMSDTTILVCFENCADDGSCDQIIAPTLPMDFEDSVITYAPAGFGNNWLQTIPGKSWFVALRLYGPLQPWIDKTWVPSEISEVK